MVALAKVTKKQIGQNNPTLEYCGLFCPICFYKKFCSNIFKNTNYS